MTLSRQLYALVLMISFLMGIGTLYISIENTRSYLTLQLATQTQDAANSLGLSLVPYMKDRDIAAMDTMVNAIFDSGYYKSLSIQSMSGDSLIERENTSQIEGVPHWFTHALTLETPKVSSIITTGWNQAGILNLEAHPGFAYMKLWEASKDTLLWSLLVFLLSLSIAFIILKEILKPLDAVEKQALDICNREFPVVKDIPKARELKRVVLAMNGMSGKLEGIINKLTDRAESAHRQTDRDELTGLMNRKGFTAVVKDKIKGIEHGGHGYMAIVRLNDFASYNRQFGFPAGDELMKIITRLLNELCESHAESTAGRIGGVDFAVIIPQADAEVATRFGESLSSSLESLRAELAIDRIAHIGIAHFDSNSSFGEILADADVALASAQHQGAGGFHIQRSKSEATGNLAWKKLIHDALEMERIQLLSQPVFSVEKKPLYNEVLIRVKDESGQNVSPASFVAMAERMDMQRQLDKYVIQHATTALEQATATLTTIAVKISVNCIKSASFSFWFKQFFKEHDQVASRMYFEFTEYGAVQDMDATCNFITLVHAHGGKVIMEHFGTHLNSFQTLRQLKMDFVKLDGSYVRDIALSSDRRAFLQTVIDIAQSLDVQTIIEHVETEEDLKSFKALGISAMQGYYFGSPKPIE